MDSSWERIRALIDDLLSLEPSEVSRVLEERCAGDEALKRRAQELLSLDGDTGWLAPPEGETAATQGGGADRVGPYRLIRELGRGGQAVVHLAEDTRIPGRQVAMKLLTRTDLGGPGALERFRREAAVASKLEHPGICTVHEAGIDLARPYIVMRFVEGRSLAEEIRRSRETTGTGETLVAVNLETVDLRAEVEAPQPEASPPLPASRPAIDGVLQLIEKTARALHAAHEAGIIHRDIKPGNIMVTPEGEPVLMDFGLAREVESPTLTREGDFFGTPAYMSPEQLLAQRVSLDARTDVWSLGVTLFECLTLRRPFDAPTREGLYQAIQFKDPLDARTLNPAISTDLAVILETALEKDRDRRYQSALDLAEDLRRLREFEPIAARPASSWIKLKRWAQRNPALAGSVSAGFLAVTGGLLVALFLLSQRDEALHRERETSAALDTKVTQYDQMSDVALLRDLETEAEELWPRRPAKLRAMTDWLDRARSLQDRLPQHEAALRELRDRAADYDEEQRAADAAQRQRLFAPLFDRLAATREAIAAEEQEISRLREALAALDEAIEQESREASRRRKDQQRDRTDEALETHTERRDSLRAELAEQEQDSRLTDRLTWRLSAPADRWRHEVLTGLVRDLHGLAPLIDDVASRRQFAETVTERSLTGPAAAWTRCCEDLRTNPKYAASPKARTMGPQLGLVPLGIDRDSGLWEFWHVGSGERPEWEAGEAPRGRLKAHDREDHGLVLVLVPGGRFTMGATRATDSPVHDPNAESDEAPLREVALDAFFFGKFEITQAQWRRLTGEAPSQYAAGTTDFHGGKVSALHPVSNVSWVEGGEGLQRWDLVLPTEARWEYACRAGKVSAFWCGDDLSSIRAARPGNLADKTAGERSPWACTPEIDDGFVVHAPVGTFAPNPFGLFDVFGNVLEWCADRYVSYAIDPAPATGLRDKAGARLRVYRGGSFLTPVKSCRSANRLSRVPGFRSSDLGVRPAAEIR